jgi:hypothetical protein
MTQFCIRNYCDSDYINSTHYIVLYWCKISEFCVLDCWLNYLLFAPLSITLIRREQISSTEV